jgi:hypothetical protein
VVIFHVILLLFIKTVEAGENKNFLQPHFFGSTISGVDIEISLSIPISDFCF